MFLFVNSLMNTFIKSWALKPSGSPTWLCSEFLRDTVNVHILCPGSGMERRNLHFGYSLRDSVVSVGF